MSKIVAGRRARIFIYDAYAIPDKLGEHKKAVVRFIGLPLKK